MGEAPSGVRLQYADGTTVECTVERAAKFDRKRRGGTVEYYVARPVRPVDPDLTYHVVIGVHPPMTGVRVDVGQGVNEGIMRGMQALQAVSEARKPKNGT